MRPAWARDVAQWGDDGGGLGVRFRPLMEVQQDVLLLHADQVNGSQRGEFRQSGGVASRLHAGVGQAARVRSVGCREVDNTRNVSVGNLIISVALCRIWLGAKSVR